MYPDEYVPDLADALRLIRDREDYLLRSALRGRASSEGAYIYFLQARPMALIKIGYSSDPIKRLKQLQRTSPERLNIIRIVRSGPNTESILHRRFEEERQHGEWFSPSFRLTSFIHSIHWADVRDELLEDSRSFESALG